MDPRIGWPLAAVAIALGWWLWGWQGLALGGTMVSFWLVMQFTRAMKVMRAAGQSPVGYIKSALMLSTRLQAGMRMLDVVVLTKSLGQQTSTTPEVWRWSDTGGDAIDLHFDPKGRLQRWTLQRGPSEAATDANTAAL